MNTSESTSNFFSPQSLADWRSYIAYEPIEVTSLSPAERLALSGTEREIYDDARIAQLNQFTVFDTPNLERFDRELQITTRMNQGSQFTARLGMAISGTQTVGKSTAALFLGRQYEARVRQKYGRENDRSFVPVVYITVPGTSSAKGLMVAFARYLGLPTPARATTDLVMHQVVSVLQELGTTLVILDEVQNLRTRAATGLEAASELKLFSERLAATMLYVGVDLPQCDLFGGVMSAQMQGRVSMHEMAPFSINSASGRQDWLDLVNAMEESFPLASHRPGMLDDSATLLFDLSGGVMGSLRLLLRRTVTAAIIEGADRVTERMINNTALDFRAALAQQTAPAQTSRQRVRKSA